MKHVISTFFPSLRSNTCNKLNLYFGQQVSAVDIPCLWKPGAEDTPVLAFVSKSQLAERYAAVSGPGNELLARLQRLQSKLLVGNGLGSTSA
jgi:hypothetical protein